MKAKRPAKPSANSEPATKEVNAMLAAAPKEHRAALQRIRETVMATVPDSVEAISYGVPAFRYKGKPLAGYASQKDHCSYFPMSGSIVGTMKKELKDFKTTKGGVQFQPEQPIPTAVLKKLILARKADIDKG
jgi:uncharacterized protein YdhG (YjbR/CyaY superfamily)